MQLTQSAQVPKGRSWEYILPVSLGPWWQREKKSCLKEFQATRLEELALPKWILKAKTMGSRTYEMCLGNGRESQRRIKYNGSKVEK